MMNDDIDVYFNVVVYVVIIQCTSVIVSLSLSLTHFLSHTHSFKLFAKE